MQKIILVLSLLVGAPPALACVDSATIGTLQAFQKTSEISETTEEAQYYVWAVAEHNKTSRAFVKVMDCYSEFIAKSVATPTGAMDLVKAQKRLYAKYFTDETVLAPFDVVLDRTGGAIGARSWMETLLFAMHLLVQDMDYGSRKEFAAFVLQKDQSYRVYFGSAKINDGAAPHLSQFRNDIKNSISLGWAPLAHVHNHPFDLEPGALDIGGSVVPSQSDISTYRGGFDRVYVPYFFITNGLETIRISREQIESYPHSVGCPAHFADAAN